MTRSSQTERPLLTLCMIVKDEAATIAKTLASAKSVIDRWIVLDTGSMDDTPAIVRETMAGVPGDLHEAPFVDFATTRNLALDRCGDETEFVIWLDADDELSGGPHLRAFLQAERSMSSEDREAYYLRVEASVCFDSARVFRSRARWRFKGAVHEVLCRPDRPPPRHRVPNVRIRHRPTERSAERSRRRWERDITLLTRTLEDDPIDARAAFYLAQTYVWLGRREEAASALRRRIEMGGWVEEIYQCKMQLAAVALAEGRPWREALELYLDAHATSPHRAEPLHAIALHYNTHGHHALCLLFARRGLELPLPSQDRLFVDEDVYRWKLADLVGSSAFWVGELTLGEAAARQALRHRPDDARLLANVQYYVDNRRKGRR